MIRVLINGHNGFYGLSDVLRLFYGRAVENREEGFITCEDDRDLLIRSELIEKSTLMLTVKKTSGTNV